MKQKHSTTPLSPEGLIYYQKMVLFYLFNRYEAKKYTDNEISAERKKYIEHHLKNSTIEDLIQGYNK